MFLILSCSCLCPIHWSQLLSWEWRCSWSSADRRCSNYIWVSTILLPTKVRLILEVLRYQWYIHKIAVWLFTDMRNSNFTCYREMWHTTNNYMCSPPQLLTHWGWDKMAVIFQTTFSNAFSRMKIYGFRLRFHWSLFARVQITIFPASVQIMAWRRSGDKPLSE